MNTFLPRRTLDRLEREKNVKFLPDPFADRSRRKRSAALLAGPPPPGKALRLVYDSRHTETQRLALVRSEEQPDAPDDDVNAAYTHSGIVRRYFRDKMGRNSLDGSGMDLVSNVHLGEDYCNAFWDGDDISFGDGDGRYFLSFSRALDVAAHELSHGIVQFTGRLAYYGQPGALNEHYADVFASAIVQDRQQETADTADWLIGAAIMGPELQGRAVRSLKDPSGSIVLDAQPDRMQDYYTGDDDDQGVHINSGIPNRAFYAVASAIGTPSAALLWYEALHRLRSHSDFNDLFRALSAAIPALLRRKAVPSFTAEALVGAFQQAGIIPEPHAWVL